MGTNDVARLNGGITAGGKTPHGIVFVAHQPCICVTDVGGDVARSINTLTGKVVATVPAGLEPYGVALGPPGSGKVYVSDLALNQVEVISLRRRRVVRRIPVRKAPALMVVSPDGNQQVDDRDSGTVTVISTATARVLTTIPVGTGPNGLDAAPDGRYVYVANSNANTVSIIATRARRVVETVRLPGRPNEVALRQQDDLTP